MDFFEFVLDILEIFQEVLNIREIRKEKLLNNGGIKKSRWKK